MQSRIFIATLIVSAIGMASRAAAQETVQSNDVTFEVPLSLTRLSPNISRVAVTCTVNYLRTPTTARVEIPVAAGDVIGTVPVVVVLSATDFKQGATVSYECTLTGFSTDLRMGGWLPFDPKNGESFTVSPAPKPILGTFTW
jgi:hypothetical protein